MIGIAVLVVLGVVVFAVAGYGAALYNRVIFLKNQGDRAWYNIDVLLKQRHDEIPKLIGVCEGSARFERETLQRVIVARTAAVGAAGVADRAKAEGELSAAMGKLFAVAESYPELKSIALFSQLTARVSSLESEITDRREFYNESVTNYNTAIETVPTNIVAGWAHAHPRDLFKVAAADTADVEVKLNL